MVTNKQQSFRDYTEYEPEDGCFAAPRGWVPAAKKKPAIRRIKGASGDLYDPKSKANRLALDQLAEVLRDIGFVVECHKDETTLRVYPVERWQYPLLNPEYFVFEIDDPIDCLEIIVCSRGDESKRGTMPCARGTLQKHLETFTDTPDCVFTSYKRRYKNYYHHGNFYLPLDFTKSKEIDFAALVKPLTKLLRFLKKIPDRNSR